MKLCAEAWIVAGPIPGAPTNTPTENGMRMIAGWMRIASAAQLTWLVSIFLPRYSGVRPTIRPPTKIASTANRSSVPNPVPSPPGCSG